MRNCFGKSIGHQVDPSERDLRARIARVLGHSLLESELRLGEPGFSGTCPRSNERFSENRQQNRIFVAVPNTRARRLRSLLRISRIQLFVCSRQETGLAPGRELLRSCEIFTCSIKLVEQRQKQASLVMQAG